MRDLEYNRPPEEVVFPAEEISRPFREAALPPENTPLPPENLSGMPEPLPEERDGEETVSQGKKKKDRLRLLKGMVQLAASVTVATVTINAAAPQEEQKKDVVFRLYEDAIEEEEGVVWLEQMGNHERIGAVWSVETFDLSQGLTVEFDFLLGKEGDPSDKSGADGMVVSISMEEPDYTEYKKSGGGERLGHLGEMGAEIDIWKNYSDPNGTHLAIIGATMREHLEYRQYEQGLCGEWHTFRYEWKSDKMTITLDGETAVKLDVAALDKEGYSGEIPDGKVWVGIAAAVGASSMDHRICNLKINGRTVTYIEEDAPVPTPDPTPKATPKPTATPKPAATPKPTATPRPTTTPEPTATPRPTEEPTPMPLVGEFGDDSFPVLPNLDPVLGIPEPNAHVR